MEDNSLSEESCLLLDELVGLEKELVEEEAGPMNRLVPICRETLGHIFPVLGPFFSSLLSPSSQ